MARNKEALVFLIDVGPSMHSVLPEVEKLCSMLLQKKLIFAKSDLIGIVLFGTKDTNNELEEEVGGYEHVFVLRDIGVVDEADLECLNLPRGTYAGDFLDAIVVGMDMLIKKFCPKDKLKKCLHLITNAQCATKEPYEGMKVDQAATIAHQMNSQGICLNCLIIREKLWGVEHQLVIDENDKLLNQFSQQAVANIVHVDNTTSLLGAVKTRKINPVTVFRGDLELSSTMKIKRFYHFLDLKSKHPGSDIPELDSSLKKITEPDFDILSRHKSITNHFGKQFELKENSKKRKLSRHALRGKPFVSDENEVSKEGEALETQGASLVKDLPSTKVEKIGDLNPVQDFEAMMARRDSSKWTSKAIKDMKSYIIDLLENSFEGHSYPRAIECLIALREGCILEQEPKEFNEFLLDMCKKWSTTDLADFLSLVASKNITLISKIEAADSDLTEAAAKIFPVTFNESPE